ncbi:MAG: hypothetical protein A2008_00275 [Candidatus Wallbacteria bacterium GWC2_49_35]|uniref:HTH tetR-type domain-containing protein n=1 Tax=Candidatus Wallbacteria bacterium GWC2_49_35 TaxID=1817813 RepID=A0A1F7X1D8_9BACT|nr:MAG: hypothetical protein A2008_00275 [Candidatus Wallbacteria bacterium GWC2_49_35]
MGCGIIKAEVPNRKHDVLKAAIKIFAKKGYPNATIRKIAARAGVSIGTIYFYYKNKAEILKEIFKRMDHMPIEAFIESKGNISDTKAFEELCRYVAEFVARDYSLMMLFFNEASKSAKLSDFFYSEFSRSVTDLSKLFDKYAEKGVFRGRNQKDSALFFITFVFSFVMFKEGPFKRQLKDLSYQDCAQTMTDVFLNGLLAEKKNGV